MIYSTDSRQRDNHSSVRLSYSQYSAGIGGVISYSDSIRISAIISARPPLNMFFKRPTSFVFPIISLSDRSKQILRCTKVLEPRALGIEGPTYIGPMSCC